MPGRRSCDAASAADGFGLTLGLETIGLYGPGLVRGDSSNEERLDGENGLLLTPSMDHLFDRGFIGFEGSGRLLVSPVAHKPSLEKMGVKVGEQINVGVFAEGQRQYLDWHQAFVLLQSRVTGGAR
jgi:hypothetical protein